MRLRVTRRNISVDYRQHGSESDHTQTAAERLQLAISGVWLDHGLTDVDCVCLAANQDPCSTKDVDRRSELKYRARTSRRSYTVAEAARTEDCSQGSH